jgi:hypothetical protein
MERISIQFMDPHCKPVHAHFFHLFEVTFEFASSTIVIENKLSSQITCQSSVMEKILDGCC